MFRCHTAVLRLRLTQHHKRALCGRSILSVRCVRAPTAHLGGSRCGRDPPANRDFSSSNSEIKRTPLMGYLLSRASRRPNSQCHCSWLAQAPVQSSLLLVAVDPTQDERSAPWSPPARDRAEPQSPAILDLLRHRSRRTNAAGHADGRPEAGPTRGPCARAFPD